MRYLKIRNWDKWQTYRKDRGRPPWIKVHRRLMQDPNWVELTDAQRGQLVVMWMLAADRDGVIPASPATLRKLGGMDSDPDISVFVRSGFIEPIESKEINSDDQVVVTLTPSWRHVDPPDTDADADAESPPTPPRGMVTNLAHRKALDANFEEFWKVYPRREAKGGARRAYLAALKRGATHEQIMAGARRYAAKRAGQDKQYTAMAQTWLNQDRWLDEEASPKKNGVRGPRWADVRYDYEQKYGKDQALKRYTEDLNALVCGDDEGSKGASSQSKSPVPGV